MPECFNIITIISVQSRHRTKPYKSTLVLKYCSDLVIGQSLPGIKGIKLVLDGLGKNYSIVRKRHQQ